LKPITFGRLLKSRPAQASENSVIEDSVSENPGLAGEVGLEGEAAKVEGGKQCVKETK